MREDSLAPAIPPAVSAPAGAADLCKRFIKAFVFASLPPPKSLTFEKYVIISRSSHFLSFGVKPILPGSNPCNTDVPSLKDSKENSPSAVALFSCAIPTSPEAMLLTPISETASLKSCSLKE